MVEVIAITVPLEDTTPVAIAIPTEQDIVAITLPQEQEIAAIAIPEIAEELKVIVAQEAAEPPIAITLMPQGLEGAQGVPGPAGVLHFHTQSEPSDLWVINHNLGHRPLVELYTIGGVGMDATVIHTSNNQIQVQFASAIAGFATVA